MKTKIKSITIINLQGTNSYFVGRDYNELILNTIVDESIEYEDSITIIYRGYTSGGKLVFEVINAPIEVEYEEDKC